MELRIKKIRHTIPLWRGAVFCLMAVGVFLARAEETVLWWQVLGDPDVTTFHEGVKKASELGVEDARVRTSEGDYLVLPMEFGGEIVDGDSYSLPMGDAGFALLPSSPEALSFMVELGNWDASTDSWVGIAQSRSYTYAELQDHIIQGWGGPNPGMAGGMWIAEGYVVPEPSSGILLLIGGGLLALRRKRRMRG